MGGACDKTRENGEGEGLASIWATEASQQKKRADKWKTLAIQASSILQFHRAGMDVREAISKEVEEEYKNGED